MYYCKWDLKIYFFFQLAYGNRNATDFLSWLCILLFCWIFLLCLMGLSVCVCMFGIFRISSQTILSVDKDNFTFLFSIWITSVFSCVIVYSKSSSTTWSISGKVDIFVFFLTLEEKISVCHHEYDAHCGFFTYGFYYIEVVSFYA